MWTSPIAVARAGQIFVLQEIAQPPVGRVDAVADDLEMRLPEPRPLRLRHRLGEVLHRAGKGRLLGRRVELRVELADHVADGELGVDHAGGEALAEAADDPVEQRHELAVPLQIVLVILDVAKRRRVPAGGEDRVKESAARSEMVDRAHAGEREQVRLKVAQIVLALIFEDVVGEPVGRVERIAVDRRQRPQVPAPPPSARRRYIRR